MIDIKRIESDPEAFDKAMISRGITDPLQHSEYLLLVHELEKIDKQIFDLERSIEKDEAAMFFKLKKASSLFSQDEIVQLTTE